MLTRVKRKVPTTTHDTELQDALLERMNFLVSADVFPFQEKYQTTTLPGGQYALASPLNFAVPLALTLWETNAKEKKIEILDRVEFIRNFPKPDERLANPPSYACVAIAESQIWFNCPADNDYNIRIEFYAIPTDVTDQTVSQLTELAKLTLINWATADGFRMLMQHDEADKWEAQGDKYFATMQKRYQLAQEADARFISPKEEHVMQVKRYLT